MTADDLDRLVRGLVPPVGADGVRCTTTGGAGAPVRFAVVWTMDGGRRDSEPIATFDRARDAVRLARRMEGGA